MTALFDELEYLTVKCGQRRIMFRNLEAGSPFLERARRDGLHAQALFHVKRYEGFAHQFEFTSRGDPDSWAHAVIAGNRQDAQEAAELYRQGLKIKGHSALGRLLGFPACCVKFFESNFVMAGIPDPVFEAAGLTAGARFLKNNAEEDIIRVTGYSECNPLLRYFGLRAVSWIPCSFDCGETRKIARDWMRLGRTIDTEAAGQMLDLLSQPLKWRCDLGRVQVVSKFFSGASASYAPQRTRVIVWSAH